MTEIGIRELRDNVSAVLERVEHGEALTVTRHGKPIARLMPAGLPPRLEEMLASGEATWSGRKFEPPPRRVALRGDGPTIAEYVSEGRG